MAYPFIDRFLSDPATREAREWLASSDGNTLGELPTADESRAVVEAAYAAGATRVLAVAIDEYPEDAAANTGKLIVELPTEAGNRVGVFAWAARTAEELGFDAERDGGQSHLFVSLD